MMVHKMVTSKYFDLAISAVIGLNVITMAMEFYMMPRVSLHKMYINICATKNKISIFKLNPITISLNGLVVFVLGPEICFEGMQLFLYIGFYPRGGNEDICPWVSNVYEWQVRKLLVRVRETHKSKLQFIMQVWSKWFILLSYSFRWNQLDVAIVFLSVMGIVLEELKSDLMPINPTIMRVMRVLRIARGKYMF